jgi:hypothetical protein
VNLQKAIACLNASLHVRTEEKYPDQWADAQFGLGRVYFQLAVGDHDENLIRSIEHYESALRVRTAERYPKQRAEVQDCLAEARAKLRAIEESGTSPWPPLNCES